MTWRDFGALRNIPISLARLFQRSFCVYITRAPLADIQKTGCRRCVWRKCGFRLSRDCDVQLSEPSSEAHM
jgi:hypothetical protein